jgi:hypothetical protein
MISTPTVRVVFLLISNWNFSFGSNGSVLQELLGAGILFCGFGVICVLSLVFIFFIVPETKGLTLEEIEAKCL